MYTEHRKILIENKLSDALQLLWLTRTLRNTKAVEDATRRAAELVEEAQTLVADRGP